MAVQVPRKATLTEYQAFIHRPENSERLFEFVTGEIVEIPLSAYASSIATKIIMYIGIYLRSHQRDHHITGAGGGYFVGNDVYGPNVGVISAKRQPNLPKIGFNPISPDLAVEIIVDSTDTIETRTLRRKLDN